MAIVLKRIYTIIFVLISLSLVGIIIIQLSWINNMIKLRAEQIKQRVDMAAEIVGEELKEYKGTFSSGTKIGGGTLLDNFPIEILKPVTVAQRFKVADLE